MSNFDETLIKRLTKLEREVERLRVKESPIMSNYLLTTGKAADSDKLDGIDSTGFATTGHDHDSDYLGITAKAADSDLLDSHDASYFATASHNHSGVYPGVDGWIPVSSTWTYASATTITVPSGAASIYKVGQGIKLTQTTVKYFYVVGVANTLLTITGGSDYTLNNAAISSINYTNTPDTAIGFPVWFAYTPAYQAGWTSMPSGTYRFNMHGKHVNCYIAITSGTSNSVEANIGLPVNAASLSSVIRGTWGWGQDSGAQVNPAGGYVIDTANHAIKFFKTSIDGASWTASGTKRVYCPFFYEAA